MKSTCYILFQGDYYEITFYPATGQILEVYIIPMPGRMGELMAYKDLPPKLKHKIEDEISKHRRIP